MMEFDALVPSEDGRWISEKFERLARVVEDYDPQFELRWIPPEQRVTPDEKTNPYVIWDKVTDSACFFASELDTPETILQRMFEGDNTKGDVLTRLDAHNAAVEALELRRKLDEAEANIDYAAFLAKTEKNFIQLGKGRKVDDQLRPLL